MKHIIKADSKLGVTLAKANVSLRKASPTLCLIGGIVASGAAMFCTVRVSRHATYILDDRKAKEEEIKTAYENQEEFSQPYTEEDMKHDLTVCNKNALTDLCKIYALPVGLYILSVVLFVEGNHIMKKRNAALSTALAASQTALAAYRDRVRSFVGEEQEADIYNGARKVVDENGNEHIERDSFTRLTDRVFDESNNNWSKEKFDNQTFLYKTEEYLNQMLMARAANGSIGFVFLNEVYDVLGFDRTPEGQYLGWIYEEGKHESYIDFGLRQMDEGHRLFANGHERTVWLNFNYDGDVMAFMDKRGITAIKA